ncbi:hypothetical protein CsSME_00023535 [Camellia sinensis var. sinensis]
MRALSYLHRTGWSDDVDPTWHGDVSSVGDDSTNRSNDCVSDLERNYPIFALPMSTQKCESMFIYLNI